MTSTSKCVSLPSWAKLSKFDDEVSVELSFEDEISYINTRSFLLKANYLDQIIEETLAENLIDLYQSLRSFLNIDQKDVECIENQNRFCISPPTRYPNTLLPLALLDGPVHVLDRLEYLSCLRKLIQTHDPRIAVCPLDLTQSTTLNPCAAWMSQILQHCYQQDSYEINSMQPNRKKQRHLFSHKLVKWAQVTERFDSILLLVHSQSICRSSTQDWLHLLTELRSDYRLPISIIWLIDDIPYESPSQGTTGMRVQSFTLPPIEKILKPIWKRVLLENRNFSPVTLHKIQSLMKYQNGSFVQTLKLIKQLLAISQNSDAIFSLLLSQNENQEQQERLFWFCLHPQARRVWLKFDSKDELVNSLQKYYENQLIYTLGMNVIFELCNGGDVDAMMKIVTCLPYEASRQSMVKQLIKQLQMLSPQKRIIDQLICAVRVLSNHNGKISGLGRKLGLQSPSHVLVSTLQSLQEILILFHHRLLENTMITEEDELWLLLQEIMLNLLQDIKSSKTNFSDSLNILLPQHRYQVTQGLLDHSKNLDCTTNELSFHSAQHTSSSILFSLLQNVVTISQYDWFQLFHTSNVHVPKEEAWWLFSMGVYQLLHAGLIRSKLRGGVIFYERVALVWSTS